MMGDLQFKLWEIVIRLNDNEILNILIHRWDRQDTTPVLMLAVTHGTTDTFMRLLNEAGPGADVKAMLDMAVREERVDIVKALLERRVEPSCENLFKALEVWYDTRVWEREIHTEIVKHLLWAKGDLVHCRDAADSTPLILAVKLSSEAVAAVLEANARHPPSIIDAFDRTRTTALIMAFSLSESDQSSIVSQLVEAGANINFQNPLIHAIWWNSEWAVDYLLQKEASVNQALNTKTPLMAACQLGYLTIVNRLLKSAPNLDLVDENGMTALMYAATGEERGRGWQLIVEALLRAGADTTIRDARGLRVIDLIKDANVKDMIRHHEDHVRITALDRPRLMHDAAKVAQGIHEGTYRRQQTHASLAPHLTDHLIEHRGGEGQAPLPQVDIRGAGEEGDMPPNLEDIRAAATARHLVGGGLKSDLAQEVFSLMAPDNPEEDRNVRLRTEYHPWW
jgi:uncharacterized protein